MSVEVRVGRRLTSAEREGARRDDRIRAGVPSIDGSVSHFRYAEDPAARPGERPEYDAVYPAGIVWAGRRPNVAFPEGFDADAFYRDPGRREALENEISAQWHLNASRQKDRAVATALYVEARRALDASGGERPADPADASDAVVLGKRLDALAEAFGAFSGAGLDLVHVYLDDPERREGTEHAALRAALRAARRAIAIARGPGRERATGPAERLVRFLEGGGVVARTAVQLKVPQYT